MKPFQHKRSTSKTSRKWGGLWAQKSAVFVCCGLVWWLYRGNEGGMMRPTWGEKNICMWSKEKDWKQERNSLLLKTRGKSRFAFSAHILKVEGKNFSHLLFLSSLLPFFYCIVFSLLTNSMLKKKSILFLYFLIFYSILEVECWESHIVCLLFLFLFLFHFWYTKCHNIKSLMKLRWTRKKHNGERKGNKVAVKKGDEIKE